MTYQEAADRFRCEVGEKARSVFCVCGAMKWKANRVSRLEELSTLPAGDPHYVPDEVFTRSETRRLQRQGHLAARGKIIGDQLGLLGDDQ